jgi:cyclophilin family peptidyl-prolyl cis-trans isomerase
MSSPIPSQLEGSHAPNAIEFLWERYRPLVTVILVALAAALGLNYFLKVRAQAQIDTRWSSFSAALGLESFYSDAKEALNSATDGLTGKDLATIDAALASAGEAEKPFLLLAKARRAMLTGQWDVAEAALSSLESGFPGHSLNKASAMPVQVREPKEVDDAVDSKGPKKPELKPALPGSAVSLMREQIRAARAYSPPKQFVRPEIPADAKRVAFEFEGFGHVVIALMEREAPKHCEAFLRLASQENPPWVGMSIDEINRPGSGFQGAAMPTQFHLGFETTKDADRSKWTVTDPSPVAIEFETNQLSHFAGAVAARNEADGKSCADRFWILASDAPRFDGDRVIFAYVVEGLDVVQKICESPLENVQSEETGRGKPSTSIKVVAVRPK